MHCLATVGSEGDLDIVVSAYSEDEDEGGAGVEAYFAIQDVRLATVSRFGL